LVAAFGLLFLFGVFVSVGSLFLEEATTSKPSPPQCLLTLTLCAFAEHFGYRQLNSWWRIKAT
jgi:hypothetical protein